MGDRFYEEQYRRYLRLAREILKRMLSETDKEICVRWVSRVSKVKPGRDLEALKGRNDFLAYLVDIMKDSLAENLLESPYVDNLDPAQKQLLKEEIGRIGSGDGSEDEFCMVDDILAQKGSDFESYWSKDRRTYLAAKPLPGRGTIVYMAVAQDPTKGWHIPHKPK